MLIFSLEYMYITRFHQNVHKFCLWIFFLLFSNYNYNKFFMHFFVCFVFFLLCNFLFLSNASVDFFYIIFTWCHKVLFHNLFFSIRVHWINGHFDYLQVEKKISDSTTENDQTNETTNRLIKNCSKRNRCQWQLKISNNFLLKIITNYLRTLKLISRKNVKIDLNGEKNIWNFARKKNSAQNFCKKSAKKMPTEKWCPRFD